MPTRFRAQLVIAATGVAARLPAAVGVQRQSGRPMGVAVRQYYRSPTRHDDRYLEIVLGLPVSASQRQPIPGYGWIFGLGDGRVNAGVAIFDSAGRAGGVSLRGTFGEWLRSPPAQGGLPPDAEPSGPMRGGAIPMGFTRLPGYQRGVLLVGDCVGMANPFTGEGIAYAMESGVWAAEVACGALSLPSGPRREEALARYSTELAHRYGSYYRLGRRFVAVLDKSPALRFGLREILPRPALLRPVFRLMANVPDADNPDWTDRLISLLLRLTPARVTG